MRKKLLSMLVLLCLAVTSAWADADADVTWNSSNVSDIQFWGGAPDGWDSYTNGGITLRGNAEQCDAAWADYGSGYGINFNMNASGGYTFTAPDGKKFTKIEMTIYSYDGWYTAAYNDKLGSGWPSGEDAAMTVYSTNKVTWTDDATSTVDLLTDAGLSSFGGTTVSSIDFYFEAPAGPTVVASGNCGTTGHESEVTWSLTDDGKLTISGTGAMADYASSNATPWKDYRSSITSVVVESGVTRIGNSSLRSFTNMTSLSLPDGLETIGDRAFASDNNAGFTEVNISASVTSIGQYAFYGCTNLATVTFSASSNLTSIGKYAFRNCTALSSIEIPAGVTSINDYTFDGCTALSSVTIPTGSNLATIGENAFYGCTTLGLVTIPASVTSIGVSAFLGCSNLTTVTLYSNPFISGTAFPSTAAVTMHLTANEAAGAKWTTFYNKNNSFQADANTEIFKAALSGPKLTLTELTTDKIVKYGNAVILKSTTSPIVMTLTLADGNNDFTDNSLQGVNDPAGVTAADPSTTFVLNNGTGGVGFYRLKSGKTLGVGKAYLTYSGASAPEFFGFGETTGVNEVRGQMEDVRGEYYDLQGRRVAQPTKGLYIVNGKKVVIK